MDDRDHFLDCLARHVNTLSKQGREAWAAKQNQAMKDDIRERMIRMRSEKAGPPQGKWRRRFER